MFPYIFFIAVQETFFLRSVVVEIRLVFKSGGVFGSGLGVPPTMVMESCTGMSISRLSHPMMSQSHYANSGFGWRYSTCGEDSCLGWLVRWCYCFACLCEWTRKEGAHGSKRLTQ